LLSIVFLAFNSGSRLDRSLARIVQVFEKEKIDFEIIVVDDGSTDDTYSRTLSAQNADERIKAVKLSRNFGSPAAFFAGLSHSIGHCATSIPDDLQRSPELLVELYRVWERGHKLVIPFREKRLENVLVKFFATVYYSLMNKFSSVIFPRGGADSFLADQEIIHILNTKISQRDTSPILEVLQLGFSPVYVPYIRRGVQGKSRWTIKKKIKLAVDTLLSTSIAPLRMITVIGFTTFFFSLVATAVIIYCYFFTSMEFFGLAVPGWASIITALLLLHGLMLLSIGILAEYIWRIFREAKSKPPFIIEDDCTKRE
jgi:polyisoprenyl-phosphate glycosyltransferase